MKRRCFLGDLEFVCWAIAALALPIWLVDGAPPSRDQWAARGALIAVALGCAIGARLLRAAK